jgi:hypothetical protein
LIHSQCAGIDRIAHRPEARRYIETARLRTPRRASK